MPVRSHRGRGLEVPAVRHRPGNLPDTGYAIVTGVLAGLALLATQVFGVHTPVAVAAATLAAAALFSPV